MGLHSTLVSGVILKLIACNPHFTNNVFIIFPNNALTD